MLETRIALKLTPVQIAELQPLIQAAKEQKTMICGSIDIGEYGSIKLNVVDRETALEIEKLADTRGENDTEKEPKTGREKSGFTSVGELTKLPIGNLGIVHNDA